MSNLLPEKVDFVIIGEGINSLLVSVLLAKKGYQIALLSEDLNILKTYPTSYALLPLSFLRIHSIPYSEISLKNKSVTAFIERYINLEKYSLPKDGDSHNWFFHSSKQLGIVNTTKFALFLRSLVELEDNIYIFPPHEDILPRQMNTNVFSDQKNLFFLLGKLL